MFLFFAGTVAVWSGSQWLSAYLIACCLLILPWPYTDPRFWLHILPFVVVAIVLGVQAVAEKLHCSFAGLPAGLAFAYAVVFCCLGLAALGYSTWITFSGPQFPYRYGDGLLRPTYLTGCSSPASDRTDSRSLHLLRVYEWHCPPAPAADAVPGAP